MFFSVTRKAKYELDDIQIEQFKTKMLEYLENEMWDSGELEGNCKFPYTVADIPNNIVKEVLYDVIQSAFEEPDYYNGGVHFDDYFGTVSLECGEDDVSDAIHEAVANWRAEMEV